MLTRTCFRDAFVRFTFSLKCSNNSGCVYTQVWYTMIVRTYLRIFDLPYRQHQYSMLSLSYLKGATILYSSPYMDWLCLWRLASSWPRSGTVSPELFIPIFIGPSLMWVPVWSVPYKTVETVIVRADRKIFLITTRCSNEDWLRFWILDVSGILRTRYANTLFLMSIGWLIFSFVICVVASLGGFT